MKIQSSSHASRSTFRPEKAAIFGAVLLVGLSAPGTAAAALQWAGRSWNVTSGGMAGVCQGNPANVTVDANGYLHLKISKSGDTWSAAEIFTTDKLGFGTYQWQVDGPIDTFDPNVVLGLYPYGPAGGIGKDGTNEIDIEYSRWGYPNGPNADWTDYPASGTTIGEKTYTFSLNGGTLSTSRFVWNATSIESFLIKGLQPVSSVTDLITSWKYQPSNAQTNIPQQALPLGMNLWCFDKTPTDGMPVEVVIRDFKFVAQGTDPGGTGGAGGASAGGASGMGGGSAGTTNHGGSGGSGGTGGSASGTAGAGGSAANAGASSGGASAGSSSVGGTVASGAGTSGASNTAEGGGPGASGSAPASGAGSVNASAGATTSSGDTDQSSSCSVNVVGARRGWALLALSALLVFTRRARRRGVR